MTCLEKRTATVRRLHFGADTGGDPTGTSHPWESITGFNWEVRDEKVTGDSNDRRHVTPVRLWWWRRQQWRQ
uniref:Uncharacterized protein n=1 Tax=Citrifermentans bremense TaxID=60035 RepID=A0A6S6LVC9_9BACT